MKEKRWGKYLCLFALAFVIAISAAGAKDVSASTETGSCGDSATYEYDTSSKTLTISGSGTVTYSDDWEDFSTSVKTVVIGDDITEIGDYAFDYYAFTSLKKVTFGDSVKTIGAYAFCYCPKLTSVTLPDSLKKIGEGAFTSCASLESITIPKKVTSIGSAAFAYCESLTAIKVASGNTKYSAKSGVLYNYDKTKLIAYPAGKSSSSFTVPSTVKTISAYAFGNAENLTSISLKNVEKIGASAFDMSGLKKVSIPKTVTSISGNVFVRCYSLTKIAVSSSNTKYSAKSGVLYNKAKTKLISYPIGKSGTSFTVPNTVKTIGTSAFYASSKLKKITLGSKVKTIGDAAFGFCEKLTSITIPATVKTIGISAFRDCTKLKTVTFKGSAPDFGDYAYYAFYGVTATVKYPSAKKSSWTTSLRSELKSGAKDGGGKLTFKKY